MFSDDVLAIPGESGSVHLFLQPCPSHVEIEIVFLKMHRILICVVHRLLEAFYVATSRSLPHETLALLNRLADRCLGVAEHVTRLFLQILSQTVELTACPGT